MQGRRRRRTSSSAPRARRNAPSGRRGGRIQRDSPAAVAALYGAPGAAFNRCTVETLIRCDGTAADTRARGKRGTAQENPPRRALGLPGNMGFPFPKPGLEMRHARRPFRAGVFVQTKDWNVARCARDGDFILVTNDASDSRCLYAAQPLRAGLVILIPAVNRASQRKSFQAALDEFAIIGEPVNRVLEVDLGDDDATLALYDLPPDAR